MPGLLLPKGSRVRCGAWSALALAVTAWSGVALAGVIDLPGWELVWQDEFDQASPDTSEWELFNLQNSFNNELQYYRPEQITTDNGNLVITATDQPLAGKQYRSGRMESWQEWGYGRFEARIQLPSGQGFWPAFWLLPETDTTPWPSGGEIDILENRGSQPGLVSSAYHWGPDFFGRDFIFDEYTSADAGGPVNFHDSFHDYAVEWEPGVLRFFVDGNNYHTITEQTTGVVQGNNAEIFDTPKKIVLNLAVGGDFGGDPNVSTPFPSQMLVDYVRVWQRPDDPPPPGDNLLVNAGFDNAGGSLNSWTTFGNSIPNVLANSENALNSSHALKIFGQFNGGENFSGASQGVAVTGGSTVRAEASAFTPDWDTLAGKDNELFMKLEFYSVFGAAPGSSDFLGEEVLLMLDGSSAENTWLDGAIEAVVPEGAVEARVVFSFRQPDNDNGAAWIDSAGLFLLSLLRGDYNGNGQVEQGDLDFVLQNWGEDVDANGVPNGWIDDLPTGLIDQDELDGVLLNWGDTSAPDFGGFTSVPEPGMVGLLAVFGLRYRSRVCTPA